MDVIGTLGGDLFADHVVEVDLRKKRLIRYAANAPPAVPPTWPSLVIEVVRGIPLARAVVDGKPVRLIVDTGAWNLQLLDRDAEVPADARSVRDVFGNAVQFASGQALLRLGDMAERQVSVSRTRAFPAFERQAAELGGGIDGLLGLSSLGASRILFDFPNGAIRLAPDSTD